jgi:hypothetical protein
MKTIEQFHDEIHWQEYQKTLQLYAIIDCAQCKNEDTAKTIAKLPSNISRSLFHGLPEEVHELLAPYLISIGDPKYTRLHEWLINQEMESPMVLWLASKLEISTLSEKLKNLLDVDLPNATNSLLRFYDPRVFNKLIRVLKNEQISKFHQAAPIWWWWNQQQKRRFGINQVEDIEAVDHLIFDQEQVENFSKLDLEDFVTDTFLYLKNDLNSIDAVRLSTDEVLKDNISKQIKIAMEFNIKTEFNIQCYIYYVAATLGLEFLIKNSSNQNAVSILEDMKIDEDVKMNNFYNYCKNINGEINNVHNA